MHQIDLSHVKVDSGELETLISLSPLITIVSLQFCYGLEHINFSSTTLTSLCIQNCEDMKSFCFKNLKNLIDLSIKFLDPYLKNLEKQSISSFMKDLHNINRISLGEGYIKGHVARLEPETKLLNELECRSFCHNKLATIEIEVKTPCMHALGLIRFLLANSSSLEILKFKVDPGIDKLDIPLMLSTSQDLSEMERAIPRVHVKFIYPHFIVKRVVPSCTENSSSEEASFLGIKLFIFEENSLYYIPPRWQLCRFQGNQVCNL
ncbi:unnamed protein product [Lupinus luteus]|uniref:FBD domain-containing protein n=1 Tax=Lupinus luteus TaxID=3873 RepID=A0AAV1X307_LUPLU